MAASKKISITGRGLEILRVGHLFWQVANGRYLFLAQNSTSFGKKLDFIIFIIYGLVGQHTDEGHFFGGLENKNLSPPAYE